MNTNINTDNYEAYLLDYLEGNLGPDEAEQLKAFVVAQGMDWDELTEELPHLEAPAVAHPNKESLKKKGTLVPLYVKIASAAAAAGLLLTVTLWPEKSLPKVEPVAELKPIEGCLIDAKEPIALLPRRATTSTDPMPRTSQRRDDMLSKGRMTPERETLPLLAELPMKDITSVQTNSPLADFEAFALRMSPDPVFIPFDETSFAEETFDESDLSLIGKGIYRLTNGRHDSFGSLISSGISTAKKEISLAATDMAMTAYYHTDERFEKAKERWQDKREE